MKRSLQILIGLFLLVRIHSVSAQDKPNEGQFGGNFEISMQTYKADSIINAPAVDEKMRANAYANFIYTKGKFSFGARYEAYLNPLLGYDARYTGHGIGYRYGTYKSDEIEVTAGHFYEQFGNGLIFRTYEDKALGYDNALDGARVKFKPVSGIALTGILGKQKLYFEHGSGIIRGVDTDFDINSIFSQLSEKALKVRFGGSFVSKFQDASDPIYNYPENVAAGAGRISLAYKGLNLNAEYVKKSNDPSSANFYDFEPEDNKTNLAPVFRDGEAVYLSTSWSTKGFGFIFTGMTLDNMNFRSDRFATGNDLNINYLPALSKNHIYALAALYPFSTQPNGQIGANTELFYKIPKNLAIIGGTHIALNYARITALDKTDILIDPKMDGYTTEIFKLSKDIFYEDFNIELYKKLSKSVKVTAVYMHQVYDIEQIQGKSGEENIVSDIAVLDMTFKLGKFHAIRTEVEALFSQQYNGNWAMGMLEYTFAPHWFLSVTDQVNYDNPHAAETIHYYNTYAGYISGGNRLQVGYGRQREGVICVGGVCRNMPAANGFSVTLSSTF